MEKIKMFAAPHKAIRKVMADFSVMAGRMDYRNKTTLEKMKAAGNEMFMLLSSHAHTEDDIILKALEAKVAGSSAGDKEEHREIERLQGLLQRHLNELSTETDAEKAHAFYLRFAEFQSIYLHHMMNEEMHTQQMIWDSMSHEEQLGVRKIIVAHFDLDTYSLWLKHMIAAQNEAENQALLDALRHNMPSHDYLLLMDMLKEAVAA